METVLILNVENYEVVVTKETRIVTNGNKVNNETGYTWSVILDRQVKAFCTILYNLNIYTAKEVANDGVNWIANQEKTSKQRFAKAEELRAKYLF